MYIIDLVIPCLNEAASAPSLVQELSNTLKQTGGLYPQDEVQFGIIIVDDGSQDDTTSTFTKLLTQSDGFVRRSILRLSRNFGKEAALLAGLAHCRGHACILLDADLQDPPALIHEMVAAWMDGNKIVNAVRRDRSSDGIFKRFTAATFYSVFARFSHLAVKLNASDFRLLDRTAIKAILDCPERIRFSKGFFAWVGFEQTDIYFTRPVRETGETKWSSWKLWNYALDGIFNFSTAPLRIWSYIGFTFMMITFIYGLYVFFRVLMLGVELPGYASLFLAVTFLGGLQMLGIGIIGEYVGRIYIESKRRPHYILREVIDLAVGCEDKDDA